MPDSQQEKIITRFKEIRNFFGLNQTDFANRVKIKQSQVSNIESGARNITSAIKLALEDNLNVNRVWLETGVGSMFIGDVKPRLEAMPLHLASDPNDFNNDGTKYEELGDGILRFRVPIIPYKAYAGYLRGFQDPEFYQDLQTTSIDVHKEYRGTYIAFEVAGDSMIPSDPSLFDQMALPGWKAIARELPRPNWRYKLHTHNTDTWVIVHNTEGILIKNITAHDVEKGIITIHSLNPKYPDEDLFLDEVAQIFNVVKYVIDKR